MKGRVQPISGPVVQADSRVPALIVKIGHNPLNHRGVGAIRTLGRLSIPVYAITKDRFTPAAQAPPDPASIAGPGSMPRNDGPGTYLMAVGTQEAYPEQAASYPVGGGRPFRALVAAAVGVRVAFSGPSAVVYTLRWPAGTAIRPRVTNLGGAPVRTTIWTPVGLALRWLLIGVLAAREFICVCPLTANRLLRPVTLLPLPLPLFTRMLGIVGLRLVVS